MSQDHPLETSIWLEAFRHKAINLLLGSVAALGTMGLIFSFYQAWQRGDLGISLTLGYYLGAYILVLILFFARRIPDRWRALGFLILLYVFSVFAFYTGWLGGSGRILLLPFIVLAAILIGPRVGVMTALLSLVTYAFFGVAYTQGWLVYNLAPAFSDPTIALIEGIGFTMAVGMISIGLRFFQQGLNAATAAIDETQKARKMLAERAKELDIANQLLAERGQKLEAANAEFEMQNWHNAGQNNLFDAMREEQEISSMADKVLIQLCKHLNFPVGTLFILEKDVLTRVGKYACPTDTQKGDQVKLGESLVGQAALEKRLIAIHDIPPDSITISSGLGCATPVGLLILPLIYKDQVIGILEFGLLTNEIDKELRFLESVTESIAIAFSTTQDRNRIDHLLSEAQRQAEAFKIREEELRADNEELKQQARVLHSGHMKA